MNPNKKKDVFIKIRVSQDEKFIIQGKANELGISVSDFLRQITLNYRLRNNSTQKEILLSVARIASNINQIARQVNTFKCDINQVSLLLCLTQIEEELKAVRKCI